MKHLTKQEVVEIWEDYCKDHKPHKFAMVYNYFAQIGLQIIPDGEKEKILEQAKEIEEQTFNNKLNTAFQTDPQEYDRLSKRGIVQDHIKYNAKVIAVSNYFEWLIRKGLDIFTEYK